MNFKEYQQGAARTFAENPDKLQPNQFSELHCAIGICTEAGELLDAYKKHIYYKRELDLVNVKEEIGDIMWYIANFCTVMGIELDDLLRANLDKLKLRYPEKFDSHLAVNRDLEAERNLLSEKL